MCYSLFLCMIFTYFIFVFSPARIYAALLFQGNLETFFKYLHIKHPLIWLKGQLVNKKILTPFQNCV